MIGKGGDGTSGGEWDGISGGLWVCWGCGVVSSVGEVDGSDWGEDRGGGLIGDGESVEV